MSSLKLNSDYVHLLNQVIELENEKELSSKDLWLKMGVALEVEGFEKEKIWAKVANDIEENLWNRYNQDIVREDFNWTRSGHFYRTGRKAGYVLDSINEEIALGQSDNSYIYTQNNSKMLLLCDNIINVCRSMKDKAKDCDELEIIFGKKETGEFYKQQNVMIDNIKNAIDNKTKIPKNTELFLLECLATVMGNTHKCGEIFQQVIVMHMKEQGKFLTQKQATKFQTGGKQSQLYLLKPTNRDFALYEGYTGTRCIECMSFRVRPKGDHTNDWECYDCGETFPPQHIAKCNNCQIPLYKERLQHVVKTGKCKNCTQKIDLPQVLIDQANS